MFETIAEILMMVPSDADFGTMQSWLYEWLKTHMIGASGISSMIGYIVYRTKTKADDKIWEWIKSKLGFGKKPDAA